MIPYLNNDINCFHERGVKINRSNKEDDWLLCGEEVHQHIQNDKHIISVSEKGALFVVLNNDCTKNQYDIKLLLIFDIILNRKWICDNQ